MNYTTYTYDPPILSYDKYRFTCDYCEWVSQGDPLLSQALLQLNEHTRSAHTAKSDRSDTPPPLNARQVLDNVRAIR